MTILGFVVDMTLIIAIIVGDGSFEATTNPIGLEKIHQIKDVEFPVSSMWPK